MSPNIFIVRLRQFITNAKGALTQVAAPFLGITICGGYLL